MYQIDFSNEHVLLSVTKESGTTLRFVRQSFWFSAM